MVPTAPEVQWQRPEVVGIWCVGKDDGDLYPGIIIDTSETHVEVRCPYKIGVNRFFWLVNKDILCYLFEDILGAPGLTVGGGGRHPDRMSLLAT